MKPSPRFGVPLWTLLVFSALLKSTLAQCNSTCETGTLNITTTTTTNVTFEPGQSCTLTVNGTTNGNGLITDLTPGTVYSTAVNCSTCCNVLKITTKPEVVTGLTVTGVTTSSVIVNWTKPVGNSSFYKVQWTDRSDTVNQTFKNITDLIPGSQYEISVTAVANDNQTEGAKTAVTVYTKPGTIVNPTITASTSSISLNWTSPPGQVFKYKVEWNPYGTTNVMFTNDTHAILSDLIPGTTYNIRVTAIAGDNETEGDPFNFSSFTRPEKPGSITVIRDTNSLNITWTLPGGRADNYVVNISNGNVKTVPATQASFTNLKPGRLYNITVTAVAGNFRNTSDQVSFATVPTPPGPIIFSNWSSSSLSLAWATPADMNDASDITYYITYQAVGGTIQSQTSTQPNTTLSLLNSGINYSISVTTVGPQNLNSTVVYNSSFTLPKAVTNLRMEIVDTTSVKLTWSTQSDYKPSYSYLVTASLDGTPVQNASTINETYTFYDLIPGKLYTFFVFTVVKGFKSEQESIQNYTKPEAVKNITAIGNTTSLSVSWQQVNGGVSAYSVVLYGYMQLLNSTVSSQTTNTVFLGLNPGVIYCVQVVTQSGPQTSNSSSVCNATFPNPPGPITVKTQTVNSINFTWSLPKDMDNITYSFTVSNGSSFVKEHNWFLMENLKSGSPYNISVVTVGAMNYKSTPVTTVNYTRPYAVSNLNQTEITTNSVTLEWNQPESLLSYSYEVQVTNVSGAILKDIIVNVTNQTITDLRSGSNFSFTVTTLTADGTRAISVTVSYFTRPYGISELKAETLNTTAIQLRWMKPLEYSNDYKYRVETTGCSSKNNTLENETIIISNLNPGTSCTFCVSVMAANGIEGGKNCTSQYTYPETVQPNISSRSNSSITVTWTAPKGNVEHYKVSLNGSVVSLNSSNTSYLFEDLSAGRTYTIILFTISGPFSASSGPSTTATIPNPPGAIEVLSKTTSSIYIRWNDAPVMTGANFFYRLTYTPSLGTNANNNNSISASYNLSSLSSGTSYNISVATVGELGFESERVHTDMVTTRPLSVPDLRSTTEETDIIVIWNNPADYKKGYEYILAWSPPDQNITMNTTMYNISNLVPGSCYNFAVTTKTADETQGAPESISNCTNARPVTSLGCQGPNRTNAKIILSCSTPRGKNTGFQILLNGNIIADVPSCNYTVSNLQYFTKYNLTVKTLSYGQPSIPVSLQCSTGITVPPKPYNPSTLVTVMNLEFNSFTLRFDSMMFNDSGGPITQIGVMITKNDALTDWDPYLNKTYWNWKNNGADAYLATVVQRQQSQLRSSEDFLCIPIGNKSTWEGYTNGPLDAKEKYIYAIVLYTQLNMKSDLVDSSNSFFAIILAGSVTLPPNPADTYIAIGAAAGVFLILFIALIGFIIYWKRVAKKESPDIQIQSLSPKVSVLVNVENFEAYFKKQKADSNCGFAEEFEDLKVVGTGQAKIHALNPENKPKNRYNNVLPYDSSRVKLSIIHGSPYDDYINANYMPGYNSRKEFIAAQGPLPTTVDDFWRMIWEKNVQTLVMLTRCNEQGRVKCEQYWNSRTMKCGNIIVTARSEIPLEDWTIRDFDIKNVKTAETRSVRHFHFTAWPDHGVPQTTELLISFRHLVREHMDRHSQHSPAVVHCSAGVGRTGTFIAIDRLIFQIERENTVDVYGIVHDLRMHRPLMVQTEDQYVFLNQCALDIIRSRTGTNVDLIYQNAAAIYENIDPKRGIPKNGLYNA